MVPLARWTGWAASTPIWFESLTLNSWNGVRSTKASKHGDSKVTVSEWPEGDLKVEPEMNSGELKASESWIPRESTRFERIEPNWKDSINSINRLEARWQNLVSRFASVLALRRVGRRTLPIYLQERSGDCILTSDFAEFINSARRVLYHSSHYCQPRLEHRCIAALSRFRCWEHSSIPLRCEIHTGLLFAREPGLSWLAMRLVDTIY